eukprot:c6876_g1_i2.p1 GENE.c6876_g1_i2~~c6876_g1_i2.p1  ORF type:complete len:330 (+),score=78.21 c6876_g1_i2:37-1026(+)
MVKAQANDPGDPNQRFRRLSDLVYIDRTCSLTNEIDDGNIEYKLKLSDQNPQRFQRLVTQMNFRLLEGNGEAFYMIGVNDDGSLQGTSAELLDKSLTTLKRMADALGATIQIILKVSLGFCQADCHKRLTSSERFVCEVAVRRIANTISFGSVLVSQQHTFQEVRAVMCGDVGAGKTTLLAVLTHNYLDDGSGTARTRILRHKHELETGRTSSVSYEMLGFDEQNNLLNDQCDPRPTATEIASKASKIVLISDLAGGERFTSTTLSGVARHFPDWSIEVVSAIDGINQTGVAHFRLVTELQIPTVFAVTKVDLCSGDELHKISRRQSQL